MSKWQDVEAERNRQSLVRLTKALPPIFPSAVLSRALSRPFVPPTPRLAIDSYWRAHPIRADRLARALAARNGAPSGWTWRLGGDRRTDYQSHSGPRRPPIANEHTRGVPDSAVCAGNRFIAWAGTSICGTPVSTRTRSGIARAWSHGNSGTRRVAKRGSCGAAVSSLRRNRRPVMEERRGGPPRPAVSGVERTPRRAMAAVARLLGFAQPSGDQPRCPCREMRGRGARPIRRPPSRT